MSERQIGASGAPARARRRPSAMGVAGAAYVGALAGVLVAVAVFLPWYATNLGSPFTPGTASGWDASRGPAAAALALGLVSAGASAALALIGQERLAASERTAELLAWLALVAAATALVLVAYRLLVLPGPLPDLLARQAGLYLAALSALGGTLASAAQVAARTLGDPVP